MKLLKLNQFCKFYFDNFIVMEQISLSFISEDGISRITV